MTPAFHVRDPHVVRMFACCVCQKDVSFVLNGAFGIPTLVCLCSNCARATAKKWPEAFTEESAS